MREAAASLRAGTEGGPTSSVDAHLAANAVRLALRPCDSRRAGGAHFTEGADRRGKNTQPKAWPAHRDRDAERWAPQAPEETKSGYRWKLNCPPVQVLDTCD